jgi:hypothetical protein
MPTARLLRLRSSWGMFKDNWRYELNYCTGHNIWTFACCCDIFHGVFIFILGCPIASWWCCQRRWRPEGAGGHGGP